MQDHVKNLQIELDKAKKETENEKKLRIKAEKEVQKIKAEYAEFIEQMKATKENSSKEENAKQMKKNEETIDSMRNEEMFDITPPSFKVLDTQESGLKRDEEDGKTETKNAGQKNEKQWKNQKQLLMSRG